MRVPCKGCGIQLHPSIADCPGCGHQRKTSAGAAIPELPKSVESPAPDYAPSSVAVGPAIISKRKGRVFVQWFSVLSFWLIVLAIIGNLVGTGSISGGSWLTMGSGQSNLSRGMPILLCSGMEKEIGKFEASHGFRLRGSRLADNSASLYLADLTRQLAGTAVAQTKTDIDRHYQLSNVNPGTYCLVAVSEDASELIFWAVPVTVKPFEQLHVDLDNSNIEFTCRK